MRYTEQRLVELGAPPPRRRQIGEPLPKPEPRLKYKLGTTEKPCSYCKAVKPLDAFNILKTGALGRAARCKECINEIGREYTRRHRETKAGRQRPDRCDCCQQLHTMRRAMHWDHDHATGSFRGWLCSGCNSALGHVDDSIARLEQMITYLKRGGGPA